MMANFVQVSAELFSGLQADPSLIEELFEDAQPAAAYSSTFSESVRRDWQRRMPQLMTASLAHLDAATRARMQDHVMVRFGSGGARPASSIEAAAGKGSSLTIEKAWHGLHYMLCGEVEPGSTLLSQAILGGTDIGEDFGGYGPARYFDVDTTEAVSRELSATDLETEAAGRYDPAELSRLDIYPHRWTPSDIRWLLEAFHSLRDFYRDAAKRHYAVVTCLL